MNEIFFPGFEDAWFDTNGGRLYAKVGGPEDAPAILLLHGFPQSLLCWHAIAPALAETHRVVCLDMKGYGRSDAPAGDDGKVTYSKRTISQEAAEVMTKAGYEKFSVFGHDRGAQVAYRMAFDMPERVTHLAVLDNLPIFAVWDLINANPGFIEHWKFLARSGVEAEKEITEQYLSDLTRAHTADGTLDCFHPETLSSYLESWNDPDRIHAFAEDYRAGAKTDLIDDRADLASGATIGCPTLICWGKEVFGKLPKSPIDVRKESFTPNAIGIEIAHGHFVMEENPKETLRALRTLLAM